MKQEQESEVKTNYLFDTALNLPIMHTVLTTYKSTLQHFIL